MNSFQHTCILTDNNTKLLKLKALHEFKSILKKKMLENVSYFYFIEKIYILCIENIYKSR